MQDISSADLNSARHGQFQEEEKNAEYWIECSTFKKNFATENEIGKWFESPYSMKMIAYCGSVFDTRIFTLSLPK